MVELGAKRPREEQAVKLNPRRVLWMIIIPVVVLILVMAMQNTP